MPPDEAAIGRHAHILKLPMELLIIISHLVKVSDNTEITVFKNRYQTLNHLSLVHRKLWIACLAAGLYDHVAPKCKIYKPSVELSHPLFHAGSLKSLGIDVGNMEVWPLYEVIMKEFPQIEELTFTGNLNQTAETFRKSDLGLRVQRLKGISLRLSIVCFNLSCCAFFETLPRENIRELDFASSRLSQSICSYLNITKPLFPNLKKIKYGCTHNGKVDTAHGFADLMLTGCKITHFEVQYDSRLYCWKESGHKSYRGCENLINMTIVESQKYSEIKNTLLKKLQTSSHNSLQIFIANDLLDNTFMHRIQDHDPMPGPFSALKLVIFRWGDINRLIETESSWAKTACLGTQSAWGRYDHHHSAWLHLADEYSRFYKCDCILLELSKPVYRWPQKIPDSFWKTASSRLLSRVWYHERQRPLLRYFIIGNESNGYEGIERDVKIPFTINLNTDEIESWTYIKMTGRDCRRVLSERLEYL